MSSMPEGGENQDYARSVDTEGEHKENGPSSVSGGASKDPGPADPEDPKGQEIPGYDPEDQPDFAYTKPGSNDGAGIVDKVMGSFAKGGSTSG